MKYSVNWDIFAITRVRPRLRIQFWRLFLRVLFKPLAWLHGQFLSHRQLVLRRRAYNGQVYRLELMLNAEYYGGYSFDAPAGAPGRRVYIRTAADQLDRRFLWLQSEDQNNSANLARYARSLPNPATSPATLYLYRIEDYTLAHDFLVYVPAADWTSWSAEKQAGFKGWLNRHKLAGKRYKIQLY